MQGGRDFLVLWKPCRDNNYAVDERTWQSEQQLRGDGVGAMLDNFLAAVLPRVPGSRQSARLNGGGAG